MMGEIRRLLGLMRWTEDESRARVESYAEEVRRVFGAPHRSVPCGEPSHRFPTVPTVLRVGGYRFYFWSRENREPPHIHVEQAERYAKFWLSPVLLADARGFRSNELSELRRLVEAHRTSFEEKWNEHLRSQGPSGST